MMGRDARINQNPCGKGVESILGSGQRGQTTGVPLIFRSTAPPPHTHFKGTNSCQQPRKLIVGKGFKLSIAEGAPATPSQ